MEINEAAAAIVSKLSTIQETTLEDAAFKDYINYFPWFAGAALLFLLAEFLWLERKYKKI